MKVPPWIPIIALILALPVSAKRSLCQDDSAAPAKAQTAQERCDALAQQAESATQEWIDAYRKKVKEAKEADEDPPSFDWSQSPVMGFVPQFAAIAAEYEGSEDAVPFLLWIATEAAFLDKPAAKNAIETLCTVHIKSERLVDLASPSAASPTS